MKGVAHVNHFLYAYKSIIKKHSPHHNNKPHHRKKNLIDIRAFRKLFHEYTF